MMDIYSTVQYIHCVVVENMEMKTTSLLPCQHKHTKIETIFLKEKKNFLVLTFVLFTNSIMVSLIWTDRKNNCSLM